MKDEEIVIRYRLPSIPVDMAKNEKEMMEEAQQNFSGQIIKLVMEYLEDNGVVLLAAQKKDWQEIIAEKLHRYKHPGEISIPVSFKN